MSALAEFRSALKSGDVKLLGKASAVLFPHLPQPASDEEAEVQMHMARAQAEWLGEKARCYSHSWLCERGLPSQLPDSLKPKAERLYPIIAEGVLVAATARTDYLKPAAKIVQKAMSDAVEDCYANGDREPALVRARIAEARRESLAQLFGQTGEG